VGSEKKPGFSVAEVQQMKRGIDISGAENHNNINKVVARKKRKAAKKSAIKSQRS
jgi:hypothetical protein